MSQSEVRILKMSPQFQVSNIEASIDFYVNSLGFSVEFRHEDFYAGIVRDGQSIHLKSGNPFSEMRQHKKENSDLDIVFSVKGVEKIYSDFRKKSVDIVQPLCERPYGNEFYITDPDGYVLAFLEEF